MRHKQLVFAICLIAVGVGGCTAPSRPPAPPAAPTSAQAGGQTIVAIQPAAPSHPTLPQFLGVDDVFSKLQGVPAALWRLIGLISPQAQAALGLLEPPPAPLSITDPANLTDDASPVAKAAAEAKMEEDKAQQDIMAIQALAKTGGCLKGRPGVEQGFLSGLESPVERVRYAAVAALSELAGTPCKICKSGACCTPKIYKRLDRMAHKQSSPGCFEEPSARVRRLARLALENCQPMPPEPAPPKKIEGPSKTEPPAKKPEGPGQQPSDDSQPPAPGPGITSQGAGVRGQGSGARSQFTTHHSPLTTHHSTTHQHVDEAILWESVSAPFAKFATRNDAWAAIAYARKRALRIPARPPRGFANAKMIVRPHRESLPGAMPSRPLAQAIQTLPIGRVSAILQDDEAFHVVRVMRRPASATIARRADDTDPAAASTATPFVQRTSGAVPNRGSTDGASNRSAAAEPGRASSLSPTRTPDSDEKLPDLETPAARPWVLDSPSTIPVKPPVPPGRAVVTPARDADEGPSAAEFPGAEGSATPPDQPWDLSAGAIQKPGFSDDVGESSRNRTSPGAAVAGKSRASSRTRSPIRLVGHQATASSGAGSPAVPEPFPGADSPRRMTAGKGRAESAVRSQRSGVVKTRQSTLPPPLTTHQSESTAPVRARRPARNPVKTGDLFDNGFGAWSSRNR